MFRIEYDRDFRNKTCKALEFRLAGEVPYIDPQRVWVLEASGKELDFLKDVYGLDVSPIGDLAKHMIFIGHDAMAKYATIKVRMEDRED